MNILHITINPIVFERRIINQVKSGIEKLYTVSVMYLQKEDKNIEISTTDFEHIPIFTRFFKGGPLKFLHFNWKVFQSGRKRQFDIIHAHDLWILPAATLLCVLRKKKLIYDAHEYYPGLEIFIRRKFRKWIWMGVERICIGHVSHMITVSEPLAELYKIRYSNHLPVDVIRNLPEYQLAKPAEAVKLPVVENKLTVLFHGHFRPGRGLIDLLRSVVLVPEVQLILIGGGELKQQLIDLSQTLNISERVVFQDYIPTDNLISTAAQADIGVVLFEPGSANYAHALPNKFFEYIMAGLPVVTSNIDTLQYYVDKYQLGMTTDPNDIRAISDVLTHIHHNRNQLKEWQRNTLKAAKELNWNNEVQKLMKIYDLCKI
jgi:glycosyltransferase involved in cell wall biosynthesis